MEEGKNYKFFVHMKQKWYDCVMVFVFQELLRRSAQKGDEAFHVTKAVGFVHDHARMAFKGTTAALSL